MSILQLKQVGYQYEGSKKAVLNNLTMSFQRGSLYAIVGKSGAGKSTLLSLISGLDLPKKGTIYYNDQDLKQMDRDEYRAKSIGVIFQSYNLLTNATVLDNIILAMNISKSKEKNKKASALKLLQKVGITEEQAKRKVLKLSGGEQQRVAIARALSHDPDVIIADEPTGNLDPETEQNIMNILHDLAQKEQKCVIVVTHSKGVCYYADEIFALNAGCLLAVK